MASLEKVDLFLLVDRTQAEREIGTGNTIGVVESPLITIAVNDGRTELAIMAAVNEVMESRRRRNADNLSLEQFTVQSGGNRFTLKQFLIQSDYNAKNH